jgi:hypothetical protein
MERDAYISPCGLYRYWLTRRWNHRLSICALIGSNPSKADGQTDDPTITKEIGFSARLNFGGFLKLNIGAYRATKPREWYRAVDPFGPDNDAQYLVHMARHFECKTVIAAWGMPATRFPVRVAAVIEAFPELYCFGVNKDGSPRHPLMLSYDTKLERYQP